MKIEFASKTAINFNRTTSYAELETGDTLNFDGLEWDCIIPCTCIGTTATCRPVLLVDGKELIAGNEMVGKGYLKTRGKPGQTPTEVFTLGAFKRLGIHDLTGETAKYTFTRPGRLIIIYEHNLYYKLTSLDYCICDGPNYGNLAMEDLHDMGLIVQKEFDDYLSERVGTIARKEAIDKARKTRARMKAFQEMNRDFNERFGPFKEKDQRETSEEAVIEAIRNLGAAKVSSLLSEVIKSNTR